MYDSVRIAQLLDLIRAYFVVNIKFMPEVENGRLKNSWVVNVWKIGFDLDERKVFRTVDAILARPDLNLFGVFLKHPVELFGRVDFVNPIVDKTLEGKRFKDYLLHFFVLIDQ